MTKWQNLTWIVATAAACSTSSSPRANLSGAGGTTGGIVPPIGSGGASTIGIEGGLQPPGGEIAMPRCTSNCKDFPPDPIFDPGVPPNAPDLFGPADRFTAGSLCVLEPQLSTAS